MQRPDLETLTRERDEFARAVADLTTRYEEKVEELSLIRQVGDVLGDTLDLPTVCVRIVDLVVEAVGPEHASLMLVDDEGEGLLLAAARSAFDDETQLYEVAAEQPRFALGEGVAGTVAVEGKSVRLEDARSDPRFAQTANADAVVPVSLLVLPLKVQERVVGVMNLSDSLPGAFEARHERLLTIVANVLAMTVEHARVHDALRRSQEVLAVENRQLKAAITLGAERSGPVADLVGSSPAFRRVVSLIERVADTTASVLVQGESGTGKEMVARALHGSSERAEAPFVAINCAALPESLLEAELFGIEQGVATGVDARPGTFERAHGGTLFLDEIGDMHPSVQAKVLRVIQERQVVRLGARQPTPVDVRLISATHRDLLQAVEDGSFRQDLYYRLKVVQIELPPLRARREDIVPLARHFIDRLSARHRRRAPRLSRAAAQALLAHPWPGNIRELEHTLEQAVIVAEGTELAPEDLGLALTSGEGVRLELPAEVEGFHEVMQEVQALAEKALVERALSEARGNRTHAAQALGIARRTLIYKMHDYGLG
ncbi:MAG: sigma 54-interacting transcriptional regulator [Bradymonadia bacterium]